jgi:hypothetical protein
MAEILQRNNNHRLRGAPLQIARIYTNATMLH